MEMPRGSRQKANDDKVDNALLIPRVLWSHEGGDENDKMNEARVGYWESKTALTSKQCHLSRNNGAGSLGSEMKFKSANKDKLDGDGDGCQG